MLTAVITCYDNMHVRPSTLCASNVLHIFWFLPRDVQSAVLLSHVVCLSVCLSVTLVDHDHIG